MSLYGEADGRSVRDYRWECGKFTRKSGAVALSPWRSLGYRRSAQHGSAEVSSLHAEQIGCRPAHSSNSSAASHEMLDCTPADNDAIRTVRHILEGLPACCTK